WRTSDQPPFGAADVELLGDVAARAGTALDNLRVLAARTRVAAALQASLLPERLPSVPGVELAARYLPAEQAAEVSGDFYDAFPLGADEYALVIGDVSGRGVDAAGLTGLAPSTLHALPADLGPAATLAAEHAAAGPHRPGTLPHRRLPAAAPAPGPDRGHRLLGRSSAAAAGPRRRHRHPGRQARPAARSARHRHAVRILVRLAAGDNLLLYTDGVVEAHGADGLFGEDRLTGLLAGAAGQPAARLVDTVQQAVLAYHTGGPDDLALLALRVLPPTRPGQRLLADAGLPADAPDR
ncbi:MAG TPA: SpoIIE family protein phosphatase, partial [Frankiaceae bacterium]|nr:SpoIIE family protein phosphatase [Frankiaceae bacterium]